MKYFYLVNETIPFQSREKLTAVEVSNFFYYWYGIVVLEVREISKEHFEWLLTL